MNNKILRQQSEKFTYFSTFNLLKETYYLDELQTECFQTFISVNYNYFLLRTDSYQFCGEGICNL